MKDHAAESLPPPPERAQIRFGDIWREWVLPLLVYGGILTAIIYNWSGPRIQRFMWGAAQSWGIPIVAGVGFLIAATVTHRREKRRVSISTYKLMRLAAICLTIGALLLWIRESGHLIKKAPPGEEGAYSFDAYP